MLTTTQVRAIIRQYRANDYEVYTNKTAGHKGPERRVKCYYRDNVALLAALEKAAGKENVTLTAGASYYGGGPGITVKCIIG